MKRILLACCLSTTVACSYAQQNQGTIIFERTAQMRINIAENNGEQSAPQTRTDKFVLTFGNNQSLWKQAEKENEETEDMNSGGVQIRMMVAGSDDILYNNFNTSKRTELRVFLDRKFLIDDSIRPLKWKIGEETKTILNHVCTKATATTVTPRISMSIDNGVMQKKEVQDTVNITAWFATDIPVSAGPAEFQGQLPGLILALDVNNGRQVYRAVEIKDKADIASIKEPTGKKRYTQAEFRKEREKMMDEMQQNGRGNTQIRIN